MKLQAILRITLILGLVHACSACRDVTIVCKPGEYPYEVSWQLQNKYGKVVAEQIGVKTQPTSSNRKYGCDPGSPKTACLEEGEKYTIKGKDEYGDTWNGASVAITFRGTSEPHMTFKGPTSGTSSNRNLDWASQSFSIPVEESSSSCVNVDVECFIGGTYPYEVSWRVEQEGNIKAKGSPASANKPRNSHKYGCIPGDKKRACLNPGAVNLKGSDSYGDGWNGAKVKVTDVRTKKIYTEWSGPTNNPNRLDKREYSHKFTIPTPAVQSEQYTIPSQPSKSMKLTWIKTKEKFNLYFKYGNKLYKCTDYPNFCKYVVKNGKARWQVKNKKYHDEAIRVYDGKSKILTLDSFVAKMKKKSLSTTSSVSSVQLVSKKYDVNDGRTTFGSCDFGNVFGQHGWCIDIDFEKCTKGLPFKVGDCIHGNSNKQAYCCKEAKFESCGIDNIGCGRAQGVAPCPWHSCQFQNPIFPDVIGSDHRRRRLLSRFKEHFEANARVHRRRRLNAKLLVTSHKMKCGGQTITGNTRKDKLNGGSDFVFKYLNNLVPKLADVFGLNNNALKQAVRVGTSENLYDLGVRKYHQSYVFSCCKNGKTICDVIEEVNSGESAEFKRGGMMLKLYREGSQIKYFVKGQGRRRLLAEGGNARGGGC